MTIEDFIYSVDIDTLKLKFDVITLNKIQHKKLMCSDNCWQDCMTGTNLYEDEKVYIIYGLEYDVICSKDNFITYISNLQHWKTIDSISSYMKSKFWKLLPNSDFKLWWITKSVFRSL